jgi:hypothetical protein
MGRGHRLEADFGAESGRFSGFQAVSSSQPPHPTQQPQTVTEKPATTGETATRETDLAVRRHRCPLETGPPAGRNP